MTLLSGVAISPNDINVRFFKPLPEGYAYRVAYWFTSDGAQSAWRNKQMGFGPVNEELLSNLQPETNYTISVRFRCSSHSDAFSAASRIYVETLPEGGCTFFV